MQKRSVMRRLVLGNIKSRKKQYLFLLLGIILAVMFLCSGLLTFSSMKATREKLYQETYGCQNVILFGLSERIGDRLIVEGLLGDARPMEVVADIIADMSDYTHAGNVALARYDDGWAQMLSTRLLEGRMPESEGEIALEFRAMTLLRLDVALGDEITFSLRIPESEGFMKEWQEKTYTLTGIYTSAMATYDSMEKDTALWLYPLGTVSAEEPMPEGGEAYINLLGSFAESIDEERFIEGYNALELPTMRSAPPALYADTYNNQSAFSFDSKGFSSAIILFAALMAVSLIAIVNSLLSLLESRRRQIALLRAIGATRNQLRQLLLQETGIIAAVAVPLGVGLSVLLVWGGCRLLGSNVVFAMDVLMLLGMGSLCLTVILLTMLVPFIRIQTISPM